ncbi:hypothetical protein KIPB_015037, partial [Kipferlia bialata]
HLSLVKMSPADTVPVTVPQYAGKTLIFDLDGTLADTMPVHYRY